MASDNESTSAAAKVFGTFELLESILLHISDPDSKQEDPGASAQPTGPRSMQNKSQARITVEYRNLSLESLRNGKEHEESAHVEKLRALYRLQRVNTTLRAVIARSKPLRARMYRDSGEDEMQQERTRFSIQHDALCDLIGTLNPLALRLHVLLSTSSSTIRIHTGYSDRKSYCQLMVIEMVARRSIQMGYKFASWRSIPVTSKPIKCELELRGRRSWQSDGAFCKRSIQLTEETTLGDVADEVVEVIGMAGEL